MIFLCCRLHHLRAAVTDPTRRIALTSSGETGTHQRSAHPDGPEGCLYCRLGPGHIDGELVDLLRDDQVLIP